MKVFVVIKYEWVAISEHESEKITVVHAVYQDYEHALKSARGLSLHNGMWGEVETMELQ